MNKDHADNVRREVLDATCHVAGMQRIAFLMGTAFS